MLGVENCLFLPTDGSEKSGCQGGGRGGGGGGVGVKAIRCVMVGEGTFYLNINIILLVS